MTESSCEHWDSSRTIQSLFLFVNCIIKEHTNSGTYTDFWLNTKCLVSLSLLETFYHGPTVDFWSTSHQSKLTLDNVMNRMPKYLLLYWFLWVQSSACRVLSIILCFAWRLDAVCWASCLSLTNTTVLIARPIYQHLVSFLCKNQTPALGQRWSVTK